EPGLGCFQQRRAGQDIEGALGGVMPVAPAGDLARHGPPGDVRLLKADGQHGAEPGARVLPGGVVRVRYALDHVRVGGAQAERVERAALVVDALRGVALRPAEVARYRLADQLPVAAHETAPANRLPWL